VHSPNNEEKENIKRSNVLQIYELYKIVMMSAAKNCNHANKYSRLHQSGQITKTK